jgi:hypothetical protein
MRILARSIVVPLLVATLVMIFMAPVVLAAPGAPGSGVNKELAAVRRATAKYHDVSRALADGYVQFSGHVPGMGAHFVNLALMDTTFDRTEPEMLLYSLTEGNKPKLVGVEYGNVVFAPSGFTGDLDEWHVHLAACHYADGSEVEEPNPAACPPASPGGAPFVLWHPDLWTLHTWLWRGNPDGVFEELNPNVP